MRILFVSASPIKREISIGNTFLNLFEDADDIELASICTRIGKPDFPITDCFCITEKMLLNNLLKQSSVGIHISSLEQPKEVLPQKAEQTAIDLVKHCRWTAFFWIQDLVWQIGRWKSPELNSFLKSYDPDLIFTLASNSVYLNNLILYAQEITGAKLAVYAWDNNYSMKRVMLSPLRWIKHVIDRSSMKRVAQNADLFYVISDVQKEDYERYFRKECKVLTKGADFYGEPDLKGVCCTPLQLVYTGNIGTNRWKSLKLIADVLESINKDGTKAQLRIYTATPLTGKMEKALSRGDSSFLMGSVPASEIPRIQREADMLVHVEAFDLKNKLLVRQSFSTKIVDYLKAARPILAVGPKDVASMDHLIRNDCAVVADSGDELERKLRELFADLSRLDAVAERGYACGRRHHQKDKIQKMLLEDLEAVCKKR